jgi:hypothetical protein
VSSFLTTDIGWYAQVSRAIVDLKDFDTPRVAERVKNRTEPSETEDVELANFFPRLTLDGKQINDPAVILDSWGRILAWHLPDVLSSGRVVSCVLFKAHTISYTFQEEVNLATEGIEGPMKDIQHAAEVKASRSKTGKINWRLDPDYFRAPEIPRFTPGSINFSGGWFAQGHEVRRSLQHCSVF